MNRKLRMGVLVVLGIVVTVLNPLLSGILAAGVWIYLVRMVRSRANPTCARVGDSPYHLMRRSEMNRRCILFVMVAVLCLGFWELPAFAESESYPMVCRGGGNMSAMYGRVDGESILAITFKRSPYADNQRHPEPGQCAWLDRPLSAEEQLELRYTNKKNRITNLTIEKDRIQVLKYEGNNGGSDLKYLIEAVHEGHLFNIQVKRAKTPWGSSYLKITRVGP